MYIHHLGLVGRGPSKKRTIRQLAMDGLPIIAIDSAPSLLTPGQFLLLE
jgi:hypothetical protein